MVKIRHMANTFRKVYKKTGNSGSSSDYQLVGNIGVNGVELDIMKGATSSSAGEIGLVPKPTKGQENNLLTGGGTFLDIDNILGKSNTISKLDSERLMFQAWDGTNINPFSWQNIMAFKLPAGHYLVMWSCSIGQVESNGSIYGSRIRYNHPEEGSQLSIKLENHISNQAQSSSHFTWLALGEEQTIYIDFYHNIQNQYPFVHFKQVFVFPLTGKMLESTI